MAKQLTFTLDGREIGLDMHKVDRSTLYGYKEALVLDENDEPCELVTLAGDGRTVVGKGGIAMAYLSADGEWRTRSELTPIDLDGNEITPVPSSFDAPIALDRTVDVERYLDHDIRSVYLLEGGEDIESLRAALASGTIFTFPFSYRGGLEADAAFLLAGSDGNVFMTIGRAAAIAYVGLKESAGMAVTAENADMDEGEDEDDFDFGEI